MNNDAAHALVGRLVECGMTVSCAESCSGGRIAAAITAVPGSSAVFPGGIVSYSNEVKESILGVAPELLEQHGAVSAAVASAMAQACRQLFVTDLAVSVTGVAGPEGGTVSTPVGTVFVGWAAAAGQPTVQRFQFSGTREAVQEQAVAAALAGLTRLLTESLS